MILSDITTIIRSRFSYQPNYISPLQHRELGKSFSEILLSQRMERAVILLKGTSLAINEVALMLGYRNSSHFIWHFVSIMVFLLGNISNTYLNSICWHTSIIA